MHCCFHCCCLVLQTAQYSTQIFSLAVLLSSLFVYNQMGGIDEAALDRWALRSRVEGGARQWLVPCTHHALQAQCRTARTGFPTCCQSRRHLMADVWGRACTGAWQVVVGDTCNGSGGLQECASLCFPAG